MNEVNGMVVVDRFLRTHGLVAADEVWVHGMWTPRKWIACLAAKVRGKKLVRMTHGSLSPVYLSRQGKWRKRLVAPIERLLFSFSDRIVTTGPWELAWCRAWGLQTHLECIDLRQFFHLAPVAARPSGKSPIHVLYLGRQHPLKGIEFLERAVCKANVATELRIVSSAFGDELEEAWCWCEVLVLPSLSENFGLVVAEALERGKFVVVSDGAPAWSDLRPEQGIYLSGFCAAADSERVALLARALERSLAS